MDISFTYMIQSPRRVVSGNGCIKKLGLEVRNLGAERVLVITDSGIFNTGLINLPLSILNANGISVSVINDVPSEPEIGQVKDIYRRVKHSEYQLLIGIGGGSVMDVTKLISVMLTNECNLDDMIGTEMIKEKGLPVIMVPTTAGTGSEATPNAIITLPEKELKVGIVSSKLIPDCILLDPMMTLGLPSSITASTGMDAFVHAMECYISKKSNPISDMFALKAIDLIYKNIREAYTNGSNTKARHDMLLGSFLGGMSITSSGTAAVHALAYPLGGKYRIPHGVSNAMLLPYVMEFNKSSIIDKLKDIALVMGISDHSMEKKKAAEEVIKELYVLSRDLGIPSDLKKFGISCNDLDGLVEAASQVTRLLDNNPRNLCKNDIRNIYLRLL